MALNADIEAWYATGIQTAKPSLRVLRKRWNTVKNEVCQRQNRYGVVVQVAQRSNKCQIHGRSPRHLVNLARYEETSSVVSPVGTAAKRGADRKAGPRLAGGRETRRGRSRKAAEQPRDGVQVV